MLSEKPNEAISNVDEAKLTEGKSAIALAKEDEAILTLSLSNGSSSSEAKDLFLPNEAILLTMLKSSFFNYKLSTMSYELSVKPNEANLNRSLIN
jgi:hypothetical protein